MTIRIKKGADPSLEVESGETPLLLCLKTANYAIMGLLIDAGADPKKKNQHGNSVADSDDATVQRIVAGER